MALIDYAIPPFIAMLTTLTLAIYIPLRHHLTKPKLVMSHIFTASFIVATGEFFMVLSGKNLEDAAVSYVFVSISSVFCIWLLFYFLLIFPSPLNFIKILQGKLILAIIFIIGIVFTCVDIVKTLQWETFTSAFHVNSYGYYSIFDFSLNYWGDYRYVSWMYLFIIIIMSISLIIWRIIHETGKYRNALTYVLIGFFFAYGIAYTAEIILPNESFFIPGSSSISITITALIMSYAIAKVQILEIRPEREKKTVDLSQPFESGKYYIFIEDDIKNPTSSYKSFMMHVRSGLQGLIVTSKDVDELRKNYGLEKTPIISLALPEKGRTYENVQFISPEKINEILEPVFNFLKINKKSVVIIDCLDLIIARNSKTLQLRYSVLEIAQRFIDFVLESDTVFILPMDRKRVNVTGKSSEIIVTKNLMREGNFWPAMLLEHLLNKSIAGLNAKDLDSLASNFEKLGKTNNFFVTIKLINGEIILENSSLNILTVQDLIHYLKVFLKETGILFSHDRKSLLNELDRFKISRFEYEFESGNAYVLYPKSQEESFEIFIDLIDHEYYGLYISRTHPKHYSYIENDLKKRAVFRWVTNVGRSEESMTPRLEHIQKEIEDFMIINQGKQILIILDALPFLIKYTGSFERIILFIANLRDIITEKGGLFMVPLNKGTISDTESSLLAQELVEIIHK